MNLTVVSSKSRVGRKLSVRLRLGDLGREACGPVVGWQVLVGEEKRSRCFDR